MSVGRSPLTLLCAFLCVAVLAALLPATVLAAPGGKTRDYIVTIAVKDSGRSIKPSSRVAKQRIRQRSKAAREATDEISQRHDVKVRFRYGNAVTGFSARMTPAQARQLAADPEVTDVRVARTFRLAAQTIPVGIKRVGAWTDSSTPGPDVAANVAVIDTGIGPADSTGELKVSPAAYDELNIAGGVNCYDDPHTVPNEAVLHPTWYGDTLGHGTHVAGTIGARANSKGTVGVAPGASLYAVRVFQGEDSTEAAIMCGLDWVVGTHLFGYAPAIDVVNMSISGGRLDFREDCSDIVGNPDADPMQQYICVLRNDWHVPVVAAAGNDGSEVNYAAPGGFDQVITVAAMTDTDGVGWGQGPNAGCFGMGQEKDDTFASYSNHGRDVDIVAPGTCVLSTDSGSLDGTGTLVYSGTSMATPHVTGAIARYIAAKGSPGTVAEMRDLVRAAGAMNWDARTDPVWSGVNDSDPPNRVLDVDALTGSPAIKTFVYHDGFKVGASDTSRTTRVDVQRSGGYAGDVDLSVADFPGAAGSYSFVKPTLDGLGPNQLGTNLVLDLSGSGGEGVHVVGVTSNGTGVSAHSRNLKLTIDRTPPQVTGLAARIRGDKVAMTSKGKAQVFLQWNASDALTGVASEQLQRRIGTGAWKDAGVAGSSSARVWLQSGQVNKFRAKATDDVGNVTTSAAIGARLSVRDSASGKWQKIGQWKTKKVKKAFKGSILLATTGPATLKTTFRGKAAAVVASIGPARGTFRVRIDGGPWTTVATRSSKGGHRKVVWATTMAAGKHTVEIQRASAQVAIDGLLVIR